MYSTPSGIAVRACAARSMSTRPRGKAGHARAAPCTRSVSADPRRRDELRDVGRECLAVAAEMECVQVELGRGNTVLAPVVDEERGGRVGPSGGREGGLVGARVRFVDAEPGGVDGLGDQGAAPG